MLKKAEFDEIEQYMDFAYALSQDLAVSAFPTYMDGIKTRDNFEKTAYASVNDQYSEILLFVQESVLGWIHYYWIPEDKYIGFESFNIKENTSNAIDEFLEYTEVQFGEYQVCFGFPEENKEAINHLTALGFDKNEESNVFVLHFDEYISMPEDEHIVEVTDDNWADFRKLHDLQTDMYWNSDRLFQALHKKITIPGICTCITKTVKRLAIFILLTQPR